MKFTASIWLMTMLAACAHGSDWPRWLGPTGDSVWSETDVVQSIPAGGLKEKWEFPVGLGYAGPAVAGGRVYVMDYVRTAGEITNNPGSADALQGTERIICLDAKTGEKVWIHEYDRPYRLSYPGGPRCTPTVAEGKVYALGAEGDLHCLDAETGAVRWSKNFARDYQAEAPHWGYAAHPLVRDGLVYCVVGGPGSIAVALDIDTGVERWRALSAASAGYCPPTIIEHGGVEQLLIWHPEALNSLNPKTGELYWTEALKPRAGMSVTAPRKFGSYLFASGFGDTGALYRLNDEKPAVEMIWRGHPRTAVYTCNNTPIFTAGAIYGVDITTSALTAVSVDDGRRLWETTQPVLGAEGASGRHGAAFLVRLRDTDTYYVFNERGDLVIAELTPGGYREIGRQHILEPTNTSSGRSCVWSHPAYAGRTLFARNDARIVAVDLGQDSYAK